MHSNRPTGSPWRGATIALALGSLLTLPGAWAATELEIDHAIDQGLSWLATQQNPTSGYFGSGYLLANTATAVLAFENEGHFPGGGTLYSSNVERGLDFLFNYCRLIGVSVQDHGNPDTNGNGLGAYFRYDSYMYETGLVMQALVASNTPDRVVPAGTCAGRTYRQVVTDMVDFLAWAQIDGSYGRGGWRYGIYDNSSDYGDNSVAQWPVLGLVAAEQWGIHAPAFVKSELEYWVTYIQNANGGSGYETPSSMVNVAKTGGLLVEFFYLGDTAASSRAQRALAYLNTYWNSGPSGWDGNKGHPYAMFSVFKGLELMNVSTIPNAPANPETSAGDWWGDYSEYLVVTQHGSGAWPGYYYWGSHLATPWYIIILQASVFPVSVDIVVPDSACDVTGYDVAVTYSVERFVADGIVEIFRDGELFDTIVLDDFMGSATAHYMLAPEELGTHTWRALLTVTGGGITTTAEDTDTGEVFETPDVAGIPDQFAPFTSFDLDDYVTCSCASIDWNVTGIPAGWSVLIDAENVVTVTAPPEAVDPAILTFHATFHWPGIDCTGSDSAIFSPNQPPFAHPGKLYGVENYVVVEGSSIVLDGTQSSDPDGDALTFAWDLDGDTVFETPGATPVFSAAGLDNPPTDEVYVYLEVCDEHGACDINLAEVEILDAAPTAEFTWSPEPQYEGSPVAFLDQSTSPVDAIVAWSWDFAGLGASGNQNPVFVFPDDAVYTVCLTVTDDDGSAGSACHGVTVLNLPPDLGDLAVTTDPIPIGTAVSVDALFTDPGVADTHAGSCAWDDGESSPLFVTESAGSGSVSASHVYSEAGVYTVVCTLYDDDGASDTSTFEYVVVYDPSAGFVTGGGWIDSPPGAYAPDPTLAGKATFGFVSKYKKGQSTPSGNTEFQFHAAGFNFHSGTYEWLVIAGPKAMYKGTGTVNGVGSFGFMLSAVDAALTPSTDVDLFRIRIWDKTNGDMVVYDNQMGEADDADPATAIGGGSIVIHKK